MRIVVWTYCGRSVDAVWTLCGHYVEALSLKLASASGNVCLLEAASTYTF